MRELDYVKSLDRGLKILEIFGKAAQALTLKEVANLGNLNMTSTQRFLNTLCSLGYLIRDENKRYSLGTRVLSLGFSFLNSSNLLKKVKPYLEELSSTINKTVNLAVLENNDLLWLYRKDLDDILIKFDLEAGSKLPAYSSPMGRVILGGLPDKELKKRIDQMDLVRLTPKTITSRKKLFNEIIKVRKQGYCIVDQEHSMDICAIGAPLINEKGNIVAGISIAMLSMERDDSGTEMIISEVLKTGKLISEILGNKGPYPNY